MRCVLLSVTAAVLAGAGLFVAGCGGPPPTAASLLQARVLSVSDLPAGWSSVPLKTSAFELPAGRLGARLSDRQAAAGDRRLVGRNRPGRAACLGDHRADS
jgi:hypothetical protein